MESNKVQLDLNTYTELAQDSTLLQMLIDALFDSATLSWDGGSLKFGGENLTPIIKGIVPNSYTHTYKHLKMEKEVEEKGRNENEAD